MTPGTVPPSRDTAAPWDDACLAATLFAVDPAALGGVCLRARAGPVRDAWLAHLRGTLPPGTPMRRVPLHVADERLLGGLDLAATLRAGRSGAERGLLAETDGGVVLLAMGERVSAATAARVTAVLDAGEVVLERDGLARRFPCRVGMVVLDEGETDEERPAAALLERCAFLLDLETVGRPDSPQGPQATRIAAARALLPEVETGDPAIQSLAVTAAALGIGSIRAVLLSVRAARAAAALEGRTAVTPADVMTAARLVLGPRATIIPSGEPEASEDDAGDPEAESETPEGENDTPSTDAPLDDVVLQAAKAAIPAGLLAALQSAIRTPRGTAAAGRAGAPKQAQRRGRPIGVRPGPLAAGARLNVVATLRAAAPWQAIRRRETPSAVARVLVRASDFRITQFQQRSESTAIFVVDASGSAALQRLGEAKGAVELLLADCYVRRDQVALLAFRGATATLLLPPTGSLVRAKRSLAGLAGGGGTPLASAIDQAAELAGSVRRRGQTPFIVMLTDGRGNIARDGTPGRARATADALTAARQLRAGGYATLLIDTSANPQPGGRELAAEMGARYLPLPYADSSTLSQAVRAAAPAA